MTDQPGTTGGETALELPADAPESFDSVNDAAQYFTDLTEKRNKSPADGADPATAENELSGEDNAAPEKVPGEIEEADPEEKLPPIERPRSWSKDDDDEWAALPRTRQEKIVANERARETDINQRINKAAETTKAAEAKVAQAEQARQQYEAKLPALMQALHNTNNTAFSDIKSQDDADLLAVVDPTRWVQWKSHQDRMAGASYELQQAEGRRSLQHQTDWTDLVQKENARATELIPDLADKDKGPALLKRAAEKLTDLGFSAEELNELANGKSRLPIYDHRLQQLIFDSLKLAEIQKAPKAVVKPDLPPVQRPGTPRAPGSAASEREQALTRKPELDIKEATELYELQSRRQRRA